MELQKLFNPSSIAIVGVSRDEKKVGYLVAKNLIEQGYKGKTYFINKTAGEDILEHTVYPSLAEIQEPVDLAVLAIPAAPAIAYLDELHTAGIQNVVLFAAGFREVHDDTGKQNEEQLLKKLKEYNMHLLGPNCIGYINTHLQVNTTFLKHLSPVGNIGFISQSGALGSVLVDYFAAHLNLGFSYFISLGNKSNIDESSALEFLMQDPGTAVVGMYLEDIKDGALFKTLVEKYASTKPIVVLKSGKTEAGSKAALSHTGGMIGDDAVYSTFFKQHGIIRATSFSQFLDILKIYSYSKVPQSNSVMIVSNAGGVGVLAADEMIENGLVLNTVSDEIQQKIVAGEGTKKMSLHNPIDLLGDANELDYQNVISLVKDEKNVGSISILLTPQSNTPVGEIAQSIVSIQEQTPVPLYPIFMGGDSVHNAHDVFEQHKIASFYTYDDMGDCLSALMWREMFFKAPRVLNNNTMSSLAIKSASHQIESLLSQNQGKPFLNLHDSLEVLSRAQIPVATMEYISSREDVKKIITYPVVVKIASDVITHKTEVGGVVPNIKTVQELEQAFDAMVSTGKSRGVFVQPMVKGYEVFIGAKRDLHFGIVLVVGLGGIYAELLHDISQRLYPFSQTEFETMVGETKLAKFMAGFRGSKPINPLPLYDILTKIGVLMESYPSIKEIDINPLFMNESHTTVADCRIILT